MPLTSLMQMPLPSHAAAPACQAHINGAPCAGVNARQPGMSLVAEVRVRAAGATMESDDAAAVTHTSGSLELPQRSALATQVQPAELPQVEESSF